MNDRPLDPYRKVDIPAKTIILGSFVFAVIFFGLGSFFRYYVWVMP